MKVSVPCLILAALACGCGKPAASPDAPGSKPIDAPTDVPGHTPGMPGLGAHAMKFYHLDDPSPGSTTSISTPAMATQASGSTIVVSVGRGDVSLFALPTDSMGNGPYLQQGQMHTYTRWPDSGTALYAFPSARGGAGFQVTTSTGDNARGQFDEITLAAVEVVEGTRIRDARWNQPAGPPLTSGSVTTDGPATLIAFWWGDGYPDTTPQSATADSGFTVVDSNASELHAFVQCAVAVKNVTAAGSYNVTWTATPEQGAQLWLIAIE